MTEMVISFEQCCGSGMFIPDSGSRIQKQQQKRGVKKICCPNFSVASNITKLKIILFLLSKKKIWANIQRIIELFPKTLSFSSQKYMFGIRGQRGTGSRIRICNTAFEFLTDANLCYSLGYFIVKFFAQALSC
jgi:hypothetical protein